MAKSYFTEVGRICNICGEFKAWELFGSNRAGQNGKKSHCRECNKFLDSMRFLSGTELEEARAELKRNRERAAKIVRDAILSSETSWCGGCRQELPKDMFGKNSQTRDGLRAYCFDCKRLESRSYRERNPDVSTKASRRWALRNKDRVRAKGQRWRVNNPGRANELAYRWKRNNPERYRENERRHRSQIHIRIHRSISSRLRGHIRKNSKTTFQIVGYSREDLMAHLERQFTKGMTWDNYGEWHIDHIVPLSSFKVKDASDPGVMACWCLSNLRPIWATENLRKNAKRIFLV